VDYKDTVVGITTLQKRESKCSVSKLGALFSERCSTGTGSRVWGKILENIKWRLITR